MKYWFLVFSVGAFLLTGCKRQKNQKSPIIVHTDPKDGPPELPKPTKIRVPGSNVPDIKVANPKFDYLSIRSKLSFNSPDENLDNADVNVRIKQDSVIWFTIGQLGITGVRGLITKDTITVVDVLHRSYTKDSFQELSKRFGFEINFGLLQSVLIGNVPLQSPILEVTQNTDFYILHQQSGRAQVSNFIETKTMKLKDWKAEDGPYRLSLSFDQFKPVEAALLPYASLLTLQYPSKDGKSAQLKVELQHKKIETTSEAQSFSFSIPSRYTRK